MDKSKLDQKKDKTSISGNYIEGRCMKRIFVPDMINKGSNENNDHKSTVIILKPVGLIKK